MRRKQVGMYIFHCLFVWIALLFFFSCKASKMSASNDFSVEENLINNVFQPVIVFLNFSLACDSLSNDHTLSLINKIIVDGELKKSTESEELEKGGFRYCILDENAQLLFQKYMPSPLNRTVEYVDDRGYLRKKDIRFEETQFSLRVPLTTEAKYISFFDSQDKQLIIIDLKK